MGMKMCMDAHLIGKNTLANFRSLLTFTGALFVTMNNYEYYTAQSYLFESTDLFQQKVIHLPINSIANNPVDIASLPACIL
jgi:hypothetical protein